MAVDSGRLFAIRIVEGSRIVGRTIAEIFEQFPNLMAVAGIRDQLFELPGGGTRLEGGDQLLVAASGTKTIDAFNQFADERERSAS
jgi:Trk K+ transport system NAD-binding subunit